jgi:uncharacterized protein (TIGR03545 family)
MRKKFVFFALVPIIVLIVVVYIFIDGWVTSGLESAGEAITGAKVEIRNLSVTISPVGIEWGSLQVADPKQPMKNLFQTGRVRFAMNFGQLLRGKYIIESIEVNNLIFGTERKTSGALPRKRVTKESSKGPSVFSSLMSQASSALGVNNLQTPNFDLSTVKRFLNTDSLLNPNNLQSYRMIDSLRQQLQAASAQWQSTLNEMEQTKQKIASVENNIRSIDVNQLKTPDQIVMALNTVKSSINAINEVKQTFTTQEKAITARVNTFASSTKSVDEAVKGDFNRVVSLARLPDLNMENLSELVLGRDIFAMADKYIYWIDFARNHIPSSPNNQKEPSPPRMKGQNIRFPEEHGYPKFWIKKILISGGTDKAQNPNYFYGKGEVDNITDNQRITGRPMNINLLLTRGSGISLDLAAMFDRRKDVPLDTYEAVLKGAGIGTINFGRTNFLPSKVTDANVDASINVRVPGNNFDSNTKIQFSNLNFVFESQPKNVVETVVQQVLQSVKGFNVGLRMWNIGGQFKMAFTTDLDEQLASRAKSVVGGEVAKLENDLRNKLNQVIAAKQREFEALLAQKQGAVMKQLKDYESYVNDGLALVQGKQNEVLKRQQDLLKNKAGNLLKDLLKH